MTDSADLPKFMWRDPAEAYERTEAQTCQGCAHIVKMTIGNGEFKSCDKGRRYGNKCKHYEEREAA